MLVLRESIKYDDGDDDDEDDDRYNHRGRLKRKW